MFGFDMADAFAVFDRQDSGCVSFGVTKDGHRLLLKTSVSDDGRESLRRAASFHAQVAHPVIVRPIEVIEALGDVALLYPWVDGLLLNAATVDGTDRSGLNRFQNLPFVDFVAALDAILTAHLAVAAAGLVAVDLYDGCFLYDFDKRTMRLIDLDEYRPGPFALAAERLPGSLRYMAPEELQQGATIDGRTTVFALGRTIEFLLDNAQGWRGTPAHRSVARRATSQVPADRFATVTHLVDAWHDC
ncbi:MAG: serine/threonine protein kinase [Actinomycetota bacterium]